MICIFFFKKNELQDVEFWLPLKRRITVVISRERSCLMEIEEDHQRGNRKNSNSFVRSTRISVTQKKVNSSCFYGKRYKNEKHPICMLNRFSCVCLCVVL